MTAYHDRYEAPIYEVITDDLENKIGASLRRNPISLISSDKYLCIIFRCQCPVKERRYEKTVTKSKL